MREKEYTKVDLLKTVREILLHYYNSGLMMEKIPPINRLSELEEALRDLPPNIFSSQEEDTLNIIFLRLNHRFGNPEARCIDISNAESLENQIPDMIDILNDLIGEI